MIEYVGEIWLGEGIGEIPIYSDDYMDPEKLYVIGIPVKEPSKFLVDTAGKPLPVANCGKLRKIGVIASHPAETLTIIDFTERDVPPLVIDLPSVS